jgi:hypothetical protein
VITVRTLEFIPYILPLPKNREDQRKFYRWVFGSDTALDVLREASLEGKIYQKDLIKNLEYSNKTIIETLKKLVSLNVLEEGMEKAFSKQKTVWVKWYTPTDVGRWIVLLFLPPREVNPGLVEKTLKQLFELYIRNAIQLCKTYNIDAKILRVVAEKSLR